MLMLAYTYLMKIFYGELNIRHWRVKYARYWITEHHSQRKLEVAEH